VCGQEGQRKKDQSDYDSPHQKLNTSCRSLMMKENVVVKLQLTKKD